MCSSEEMLKLNMWVQDVFYSLILIFLWQLFVLEVRRSDQICKGAGYGIPYTGLCEEHIQWNW